MTDPPSALDPTPPPPPVAPPRRHLTLQRVIEVVGLVGVVGSLLFVGLQIRQSSVATRAATNAAVADAFRDLSLLQASSPALARAFAAHAADPAAAPAEAQVQMLGFWRALFHIWADVHRQHQNGTVDPAIYDAVVREIASYGAPRSATGAPDELELRRRQTQWAWASERFLFSADFQALVDALMDTPADAR
ncbi:hypothetical protein [Rubrivirga sp. IMCC45206]|uniref:hypothetical protein n=1 Tax=Rubrivirga sp. IMCC45206 TaxID=3391614 RepID=UPI00399009A0